MYNYVIKNQLPSNSLICPSNCNCLSIPFILNYTAIIIPLACQRKRYSNNKKKLILRRADLYFENEFIVILSNISLPRNYDIVYGMNKM